VKQKYISDYVPNEPVEDIFLVSRKEVRPKKSGGDYLFVVLNDRTGKISAFMWGNVEVYQNAFQVNDFVEVKGVTKEYNRSLQVTLHKVQRLSPDELDLMDFIPSADKDLDEVFNEFYGLLEREMTEPHLRQLMQNIFHDEQLGSRFRECPAAKSMHHAYLGGLMEHTLSVLRLCLLCCTHYPFLDKSLLLAGAALHDFGKVFELSWGKSFDYTDQGRLIGHITMASVNIDRKIQEIEDFPPDLRLELLHMILSHHGQLEFGSPKRPKTLEALVLSYLDDMDAKVQSFIEAVEQADEKDHWTIFNPNFQRFLYRRRYLETIQSGDEDHPPADPPPDDETPDEPDAV
jgi:3'-5' exoribonuclease